MFFSRSLYHSGNKVLCWAPKWLVVDAVAAPLLLPYNLNSFHFFTSYCYVGCGRLTDMEVPSAKLTPTHTCRSRVWTPQCFTVGHCLKIVIELFVLRCTYAEILLFRVRFFTLFFFSNNDYLHFCSVKYSTVRIVNHVCLEKTASYLQGRSMLSFSPTQKCLFDDFSCQSSLEPIIQWESLDSQVWCKCTRFYVMLLVKLELRKVLVKAVVLCFLLLLCFFLVLSPCC